MGNTGSTTPNSAQQYYFYYGEFCNPSFYLEKNLVHYNYSIETEDLINILDSTRLIDIASIIISRPDKLTENEISFLLEKLIEIYDNDQKPNEQNINKNSISAIDEFYKKLFSISNYRKKEFFNKKELTPIRIQNFGQSFDFSKIINNLSVLANDSFNNLTLQDISEAFTALKSILPIRATIAPDYSYFYPKEVDCYTFDFNDASLSKKLINNLGPYGLSSNGQFIFLLSSLHLLFVFPILNNGALMPPKLVRLPFQEINDDKIPLTTESCITAFPGFLEIHPYPASPIKVKINIDEVASKNDYYTNNNNQTKQFFEMKLETENLQFFDIDPNDQNYLCKITDGIVYVIVHKLDKKNELSEIDFVCKIADIKTGQLLNQVKLHKNQQQESNNSHLYPQWNFDELLPEMFPDLDYCSIPIETNGTTISFIFEVEKEIAIYRTFSLMTGEFLSDERINLNFDENKTEKKNDSTSHIISTSIDLMNNCRWILAVNSENHVFLRKTEYYSSIDPYIFHIDNSFISSYQRADFLLILNNLLKHFCCSKISPDFLLCRNVEEFQSLLKILHISIAKDTDKLLIQTLCLLVSLNIVNNDVLCQEKNLLFEIISKNNLEIGLKFLLFIPNFSSLMKVDSKQTIDFLFYLFEAINPIETKKKHIQKNPTDILLISYTLKVIEKCNEFGSFPLLNIKNFQKYIENESFLPIFIAHQHAIIQNVTKYIETENIIENQKPKKQNYLNNMFVYITKFIPLFLNELQKYKNDTIKEFPNNIIYKFFHNFLYLMAPLTQNHDVSQGGVNILTSFLLQYIKVPDSTDSLKMGHLETCYLYGLSLSTLVSGGGLDPFEKKFDWIIRSNLDLLENNDLLQNLDKKVEKVEFLETNNLNLDYLYSKIMVSFNRQLKEPEKNLDKNIIFALSKHMNCYIELMYFSNPMNFNTDMQITKELRQSFLQMQKIRNICRKTPLEKREEKYNSIIIKCHMLFNLNSKNLLVTDSNERANILGDFIMSSYSPEYIKGFLFIKKSRIPQILTCFPLLNNAFKNDENQILETVIGHVMNKYLTSFEALNSFILIKGDAYLQREDINTFLQNIYPITQNQVEKTYKTRIIPYRFFKAIKVYPDILESFLSNLLSSFDQHSNDPGFYALVVLIIKMFDFLPTVPFQSQLSSLIETPMSTYKLSIIEHILEKINDDFILSDDFVKLFFEDSLLKSPIDIKIVMRIRYLLSLFIKNDSLDDYLKNYLFFIGDHLNDINKYYSLLVTELITLLRKIYLMMFQDETSPLRNNSIYLLLMNSISNKNNYNERVALSLCAIFGFQMEATNPYSVIKVCLNVDISNLYLLIQRNNSDFETNSCTCYSLPFDISNEPQTYEEIKRNAFITVVPEVNYTNVIFADKLKNMLITSQLSSKRFMIFPVCAQALLNFYTIRPDIIDSNDQNLIDFMCSKITHFNDIYMTFNKIKSYHSLLNGKNNQKNSLQILPDISNEFGELRDHGTVTLLSLQIQENAPKFLVNIEITDTKHIIVGSKEDVFNFGVISDSFEQEELRISTVGFPTGINFPEKKKVFDLEKIIQNQPGSQYNLSFFVNMQTRKFSYDSIEVDFPIGRKFRLIVFTRKDYELQFKPTFAVENQMDASNLIFNYEDPPDLDKIITTKKLPIQQGYEDFNFLKFPDFVNNVTLKDVLKEDYHQYPKINQFSHDMDLNMKLKLMPFIHPMSPVLHLYKAMGASKQIIEHHLSGLYLKLGKQWITVLLMKIAMNNPFLIRGSSFDLFTTFSIPLETFNQEEFDSNRFPFSLENPPWKISMIDEEENKIPNFYYLTTNDMVTALSSMIKDTSCMNQISHGLFEMSASSNLHQIALPQKYSFIFINQRKISLNQNCFVFFNNYEGIQKNAAFIIDEDDDNKKVYQDFPLVFKNKNNSAFMVTQLNINTDKDCQVSILDVNSNHSSLLKNDWVIDTPIELLIHLKNFAFAAKTEAHHALVKTILLDLYLGNSPLVIPFIDQFQDFVQMKCSASLFYKDELYMKHLVALGGYLNSMEKPDNKYVFLYENEQRLMSSKFTMSDAAHFPEFFPEKTNFPELKSDSILIPYEPVDPGSIKDGFQSRILMIKHFFQKHESIVGCHFWDILPLWNRIVDSYGFDDQDKNESLSDDSILMPEITKIEDNKMKVSNPTSREFNIILKFHRRNMTTAELRSLILQYSLTKNFDSPSTVYFEQFDVPIKIGKGDTFFAIITDSYVHDPWASLCYLTAEPIKAQNNFESKNDKEHEVKITKEYKSNFIQSMKTFLLDWTQENTESLLNIFTIEQLKSPSFETISQIVLESDLSKLFPKSVLILRSLLIHQFSYIRYNHKDSVSEFLWNSCSNLVPILEKCTILQSAIAKNEKKVFVTINRQLASKLVKDYKNKNEELNNCGDELCYVENRNHSIISQFTQKTKLKSMNDFRGVKPFNATFEKEEGVDAGGLTKELINELSASIFEPSSQLFMKAKCDEEYFIPETRKRNSKVKLEDIIDEYYTTGILLGIICRTGFPQYFPLAPFIWKYISNELITPDDIAEIDRDFKIEVKNVRNKIIEPSWKAISWTGYNEISLQKRIKKNEDENGDQIDDEIESYLNEYTKCRLNMLNPMLNKIREGFLVNIDLRSHPMLSGKVLSFLVQGSSDITSSQLKDITKVMGYGADVRPTINIFWEVVEEFTVEQRRLLLKFITGITRIPKINDSDSFLIKIQFTESENALPTSATCFNKLTLPLYKNKDVAKTKILFAIQNCATMEKQ